MIYPPHLEEKLGFDQVRQQLKSFCSSSLGQAFVEKIAFLTRADTLERLLGQTREFQQILEQGLPFPAEHYHNMQASLRKAEIEGMALDIEECARFRESLTTLGNVLKFWNDHSETFPLLAALGKMLTFDRNILHRLDLLIDDKGKLRDNASSDLLKIRRQLNSEQASLRKRLDSILRKAQSEGLVADDTSLTIRNGRMVIPILAEHKRKIRGFIHDESATGQTVYLEPGEIFESNNLIRELEYEEKREVHRILVQFTDFLRPHLSELGRGYQFLGLMDFIRAKARLAMDWRATYPTLYKKPHLRWMGARHPLLEKSLAKQGKAIVAQNISLNEQQRIIVISGPNAGGKSAVLKTLGLLQYSLQCGLPIPIREGSEAGIFDEIFLDIGDEQSLENDLSTYSSHLTHMRSFVNLSGRKSLFLIDEFGSGTEPQYGGAIAEALLESLNQNKAWGVVTTHFGNLKKMAERTEGLANAAMRFDAQRLEPLYELEIGLPGSSFALEIAQKIGLPKAILNRARHKVGEKQVAFDTLMREMELEKQDFARKNAEISKREAYLEQATRQYTELKNLLEAQKTQALNEAKVKAKELLADANRKIEATIRSIREAEADKELTRELRKELDTFKAELEPQPLPVELPPAQAPKAQTRRKAPAPSPSLSLSDTVEDPVIGPGSFVLIDGQTAAQVLSVKDKSVEIRIGELKSVVKLNRLEKISARRYQELSQEVISPARTEGININQRMADFNFNLDLRGKRGEEALTLVDTFLDNAMMLGMQELRIVHGKGDGILRQLVRNHLKGYKQVVTMGDEHADRGGAGVTVVTLDA